MIKGFNTHLTLTEVKNRHSKIKKYGGWGGEGVGWQIPGPLKKKISLLENLYLNHGPQVLRAPTDSAHDFVIRKKCHIVLLL